MLIGISGGGGDLAQRTIHQLIENGTPPSQLVVTSRNPEKLTALVEQGVQVVEADFSDPYSVRSAFTDCERVVLTSIVDPLFDIKGKEYHANAIKACAEAGVKHIMYTSAIGAFLYGDNSPFDVHADAEWQLHNSGCNYTLIRNGLFAEMLEFDLGNAIEDDETWVTVAEDGLTAWVSKDDMARSVAAILKLDTPSRLYTLTGPKAISHSETVDIVNKRFGTNIVHKNVSPAEYRAHFEAQKEQEVIIHHLLHLFLRIGEGQCSTVTNDVERLTGRTHTSFIECIDMRRAPELI